MNIPILGQLLYSDVLTGATPLLIAYGVVVLIVAFVGVIALWRLFEKAGRPGWWAIIPIWNLIVLFRIAGRPVWWAVLLVLINTILVIPLTNGEWWYLLLIIPLINLLILFMLYFGLARSFGKSEIWVVYLLFFNVIALLLLAFGDAQYLGPGGRRKGVRQHRPG